MQRVKKRAACDHAAPCEYYSYFTAPEVTPSTMNL